MDIDNIIDNTHVIHAFVDHIYVLYVSPCECIRIKNLLNKKGITAEYYQGVNGHSDLFDEFDDYVKDNKGHIKTVGGFGHIHSFIGIIKDAIKHNYKNILILEPDVYFSNKFDDVIERYLKTVSYTHLTLPTNSRG